MNDLSGHYGRLTDQEILATRFTIEDPGTLPDLISEVPDPRLQVIVEFAYGFDLESAAGSQRRVKFRCVHCKYPNHFRGYVMKISDGRRFLCGHRCGEKLYGVDFRTFLTDYEAAKDRQLSLRRMDRLRAELPAFDIHLDGLLNGSGMRSFDIAKGQIRDRMKRLHGALEMATLNDGMKLYVSAEVRDYAAENRADQRYDRDLEDYTAASAQGRRRIGMKAPRRPVKPVMTREKRLLTSLPTPTLFTAGCFRRDEFVFLVREFRQAALASPGLLGDVKAMDKVLKNVGAALDRLVGAMERYAEMRLFFDFPTLSAISEWATRNETVPGTFRASLNRLSFTNLDGDEANVEVAPDLPPVDLHPFENFRRVLSLS